MCSTKRKSLCMALISCKACPGRYLAEEVLFLYMVTTLSVFDVTAVNSHMTKYELDDGTIRYVNPLILEGTEDESV